MNLSTTSFISKNLCDLLHNNFILNTQDVSPTSFILNLIERNFYTLFNKKTLTKISSSHKIKFTNSLISLPIARSIHNVLYKSILQNDIFLSLRYRCLEIHFSLYIDFFNLHTILFFPVETTPSVRIVYNSSQSHLLERQYFHPFGEVLVLSYNEASNLKKIIKQFFFKIGVNIIF